MARMKNLKDISGETIYPKTVAKAVMFDDTTTVNTLMNNSLYLNDTETELEEINPIDANTLQGHDSDYFVSKDAYNSTVDNIGNELKETLVDELAKCGQLKPEFANDISECTDTSKLYVLPDGYIYAFMSQVVTLGGEDKMDRSTIYLDSRYSGNPGTLYGNQTGYYATAPMPIDISLADPMRVTLSPSKSVTTGGDSKIILFDKNKNVLGSTYIVVKGGNVGSETVHELVTEGGCDYIDIGYVRDGAGELYKVSYYDSIAYFAISDHKTSSSLTLDNVPVYSVVCASEIRTEKVTEWISTGHKFIAVPVDDPTVQEIIREEVSAIQLKPEFANNIDECVDKTKVYVLPDGFIYAYITKLVYQESAELFDPSTISLNTRYSGSPGSVQTSNGYICTDFIPVDIKSSDTVKLRMESTTGIGVGDALPLLSKLIYFDSNKNSLGTEYVGTPSILGDNHSRDFTMGIKQDGSKADYYDNIAYVVFNIQVSSSALTSLDPNLITSIYDPNGGGYKQIEGWANTGNAFVPADYEDIINEVQKMSFDHEERLSAVESSLTGSGSSIITVPSFWKSAVDECVAKIQALQVGRSCVTFPFFSDNHTRNGYSGLLIAYIMAKCHIPYAFFGGDSIDNGYIASESAMITQDRSFDAAMSYIPNGRFCRAVGNHDGYWAVSADEKHYYTDSQIYELFLREESVSQNKHFGGDGTYYYVDDIASKVRWIVLDTNDGTVEAEQIAWMQNTALSFSESGWAVVFISHQPISNHYHAGISNAEEVRTVVKNYINGTATNKADVIGWFSGHIHRDRIYTGVAVNTSDDSVGADMGFKQVTITSDHTSISYDTATKHTVADDDQSHAIDFVTINKATRTVNLTRLGIGNDRSYTY